ncbi:Poly(A) RNA polymerase cid13 [Cymbomonas tetramitiformis]|uniref:Poly(A) RNA polymerase cid13 n=1 Tax=Cymbomonas tetramitiformis TaxID=36881 RepID=A0AAE0GH89_9CHLO|nr:Poly(A) RNA polymerase cid13 [Cymbomonas tetramitiformis]
MIYTTCWTVDEMGQLHPTSAEPSGPVTRDHTSGDMAGVARSSPGRGTWGARAATEPRSSGGAHKNGERKGAGATSPQNQQGPRSEARTASSRGAVKTGSWWRSGGAVRERWRAQRQSDSTKRTVYVCDIGQEATEEQLAYLFANCGQVIDCRICGDPRSNMRFAFVEFASNEGADKALCLSEVMLGWHILKVFPSKTPIIPVNPSFLPKTDTEREMCERTVYVTHIDKAVAVSTVRQFFEETCGEVLKLRILGDTRHPTQIAFVEFLCSESANAALGCSGTVIGANSYALPN